MIVFFPKVNTRAYRIGLNELTLKGKKMNRKANAQRQLIHRKLYQE